MTTSMRVFLVLSLLAAPAACDRARASRAETEAKAEKPPAPVVLDGLTRGPIEQALSAASTIEAERVVTVHAESTGRLIAFTLDEGDSVRQGQLVGRVRYDNEAAVLDRARTQLDKAERDLELTERLHRDGHASDDELVTAKLALETALLDVGDGQRGIKNTRVTAPFAGVVTERFVTEGSFVSAGAQLVSIVDFDTLVARVYVPERELDRLSLGQPAQVQGKAARSRRGSGVIRKIAPVVDAATGTVKVTVALPPELAGGERGFLPGMYAEVRLTTERREDVLRVEKRALVRQDDAVYVFVLQPDETVKRVRVQLGLQDDTRAEVRNGLSETDRVVVSGQAGLSDGARVVEVDANGEPVAEERPLGADAKQVAGMRAGSGQAASGA